MSVKRRASVPCGRLPGSSPSEVPDADEGVPRIAWTRRSTSSPQCLSETVKACSFAKPATRSGNSAALGNLAPSRSTGIVLLPISRACAISNPT